VYHEYGRLTLATAGLLSMIKSCLYVALRIHVIISKLCYSGSIVGVPGSVPRDCTAVSRNNGNFSTLVWLNGLVVSALGIRARGPGFDSRVVPLFHWGATMGKLFTHIAKKGVFGA